MWNHPLIILAHGGRGHHAHYYDEYNPNERLQLWTAVFIVSFARIELPFQNS